MIADTKVNRKRCELCRFAKRKPGVPAHVPGWLYCVDQAQNVAPTSRCDRFEETHKKAEPQ